ncbi:acyl-ACP--UDP-N-acetylglucosamine O-acyltransferase [Flavobacterium hungaricum]|uniref:Acyl-ACP--UDP-N-acetylglucosamine O-acyltransferase n=1 Tax=Flavobacterium hungaricum TaxID=2082725 RepID=A0ABR9TSL2_9FLAO|nr:acyl-ACP--UDP-N-acetylglucosamine O-acyltransferase [Flavobacterium hungaricum]MBE8727627.1 acyl-ACP--UDP-N-acetylglucosamine O-acyltransferase [Flavobacterium hungaricum]
MQNTLISKEAEIGSNVVIGNFSCIESGVTIGENTRIGNNVTILNGTTIGNNCQIHSNCVLGGIPQDLKFDGEYSVLQIGDQNIIREFVTINRGTRSKGCTIIGNGNLIMSNAHIGHDSFIGDNNIIGFSVGVAGEVHVGNWVNISGLTAIHQFSRIGDHSMISGLSKIVKDIPPFITAAKEPLRYMGLNSIGLRRRGFSSDKILELKAIYQVIFEKGRNTSAAIEIVERDFEETRERNQILSFIKCSERGILKGLEKINPGLQ